MSSSGFGFHEEQREQRHRVALEPGRWSGLFRANEEALYGVFDI